MRKRAILLTFASLLTLFGCVDYAEPTGPVDLPPPEDGGGEFTPAAVSTDGGAPTGQRRAGRSQRN